MNKRYILNIYSSIDKHWRFKVLCKNIEKSERVIAIQGLIEFFYVGECSRDSYALCSRGGGSPPVITGGGTSLWLQWGKSL